VSSALATSVKQTAAGVLDVGYVDVGPSDGPAVVLLHGWPYDIHTFAEASPLLAAEGYRVIVPYLRGYGTTRFLSDETSRNGQQSVLAVDTVALMDVLGIEQAVLAGADWGARTADVVAALWPERCSGLVSVSGYLIGSQRAGELPLAPEAERQWWYQYYFATERGRAGYERYRREFARLIWRTASPQWDFDDATFERSAAALDNPDHVAIVIDNYRWRIGLGDGSTTRWSAAWPRRPSSTCRRSPSKATPTARRIRIPAPTRGSSPARTSTGPSPEASATTCLRRRLPLSPRRSSTSTPSEEISCQNRPPTPLSPSSSSTAPSPTRRAGTESSSACRQPACG
jgi:pimeloyl-ACP methyl ester carboxylesterase